MDLRGRGKAYIANRIALEERGFGSPCWIWQGHLNHGGYPRGCVPGFPNMVRVHRASYELHVGPIPEGLTLDHLCRVKECCNPAHLEPVTALENIRRALKYKTHCPKGHEYPAGQSKHCSVCRPDAHRRRIPRDETTGLRTHCRHGHELTPENIKLDADGTRRCRTCRRKTHRSFKARRKEIAARGLGREGNPTEQRSLYALEPYASERRAARVDTQHHGEGYTR